MSVPGRDVRAVACAVLERTLGSRHPVDPVLASHDADFETRDRRLLAQLVYGVLRWLRRLDHIISVAASRPIEKIDRELRFPLRIGVYQLVFLARIPPHAAVNASVELARERTRGRGSGFVNAVLRRIAAAPTLEDWPVESESAARRLGIETSHPDLLIERWIRQYGQRQAELLAEANNRQKPLHLLSFEDRGGRRALAAELAREGVVTASSTVSPFGLIVRLGDPVETEAFREGRLYIQDEASQAAALVPPPIDGERVLDVASFPGGKSLSLLATGAEVRVICTDVAMSRLSPLRDNQRRLGRQLPIAVMDACQPAIGGAFQRVIADLPCSGTGTLRKHPELKWRVSRRELDRLAAAGLALLDGVADLVAPGGILAAITCSLEDSENERVAERFLRRHREFSRLSLEDRLPPPLSEFVRGPGLWRILTGGHHDGFTAQILYRSRGTVGVEGVARGG